MDGNDTSEHEIHRNRTGLIFLSSSQLTCLNKMERKLAEMRKTIQKLIKVREREREREGLGLRDLGSAQVSLGLGVGRGPARA